MNINQTVSLFKEKLSPLYDNNEIRSILFLLFEHTGISKNNYFTNPNLELTEQQHNFLQQALGRLQNGEPVQYITGITQFYNLDFQIDRRTLIPRPETEELVDLILKNNLDGKTIIDIGTGSGCIAVSIAKHSKSEVYATDISAGAIAVAQKNAQKNKVKVNFIRHDIFNPYFPIDKKFDLIVSNPPYVTQSEKKEMRRNVVDYEPHTALFVPDDSPVKYYKAIAIFAQKRLKHCGKIYLEINPKYAEETLNVFDDTIYNKLIINDLSNKKRFVILKQKQCRNS